MELSNRLTLLSSPAVDLNINPRYGENCMHFHFKGKFTKEVSALSTKAWIGEFEDNPQKKYTHLWDCTQMKNFDFGAQEDWMNTLSKHSHQIEYIMIVSDSLLIRGAARVMSKFSKLDLRVFKSLDEFN